MEVKSPRRALAISLHTHKDHLSRVIHDLSGSKPVPEEGSLAGITHNLPLKTRYYAATVPLWLDLVDDASAWSSSFLSPEAAEVLAVLGGLVVVFGLPEQSSPEETQTRQLIEQVGRVVHDGLGGWEWDGVKLAVGVGENADVDEWDELCAEAGLEFVQVGGSEDRLQQFGEKTGIPRVKEALEANEWDQVDAEPPSDDDENQDTQQKQAHLDPENMDFGLGQTDMEALKKAIWAGAETDDKDNANAKDQAEDGSLGDDDVAKVEAMMRKLQAAREAGETMSEPQRRKMAAKAVEEVMREL